MLRIDYHYYFFDENLSSLDPQELNPGPRIFKVRPELIFPRPQNSDGPFNSVRGLKKNSHRYQRYKIKNNKRAVKISEEKWIREISSQGVISTIEKGYPEEFMKSIEHATLGSVRKSNVSGVHFADSRRVKFLEIIDENVQGVFEAKFQVLDHKTKEWYEKEGTSTFFPRDWSLHKLFHECAFAYFDYGKELVAGHKNLYESRTKSGIDVRIAMDGDKIKTIYPTL